jgi:hypothetical protein
MYKLGLMDNARVRPTVLQPSRVQTELGYRTRLLTDPPIVGDSMYVADGKGHEMMHQGKFPTEVGRAHMQYILGKRRSMLPAGNAPTVVSNPMPYKNTNADE